MLPYPVTIIPLYLVFRHLGWIDIAGGYLPLTVPAFFGAPFFIFLLRQFFASIPVELSEAAKVDGASELRIYAQIILPLSQPGPGHHRAAHLPLHLYRLPQPADLHQRSRSLHPLAGPAGLLRPAWRLLGPLMAASAMFTIPTAVLFLLAQRTFIQGIATSGLKG